ncbi:hypothetical protein [Paenibacillus tengchongensis]|uniref:hypothetical protein n=1 Tax=Paenibacillus tengchongensis TaxID=2608684 RepID=UPI00124EBA85|nr:hypothetical protein [Paenibacillus tengchongensis]
MTEAVDKVKLSQWDALLLESLRGLGWTDEALLNIAAAGELPADDSDFHFDYSQLAALAAEQPAIYRQAVTQGYQIKYNTIGGIRSWILVAFGREPQVEREEGKEAVEIALTEAEQQRLQGVLSIGWRLVPAAGGVSRIEPVRN